MGNEKKKKFDDVQIDFYAAEAVVSGGGETDTVVIQCLNGMVPSEEEALLMLNNLFTNVVVYDRIKDMHKVSGDEAECMEQCPGLFGANYYEITGINDVPCEDKYCLVGLSAPSADEALAVINEYRAECEMWESVSEVKQISMREAVTGYNLDSWEWPWDLSMDRNVQKQG